MRNVFFLSIIICWESFLSRLFIISVKFCGFDKLYVFNEFDHYLKVNLFFSKNLIFIIALLLDFYFWKLKHKICLINKYSEAEYDIIYYNYIVPNKKKKKYLYAFTNNY